MFDWIDPAVMQIIVQVFLVLWGFATFGSLLLDGLKEGGIIQDGQTPKWLGILAVLATVFNGILNVLPGGADGIMADLPVLTQIAGHVVMVVVLALSLKLARFPLKWLNWTISLTQRKLEASAKG